MELDKAKLVKKNQGFAGRSMIEVAVAMGTLSKVSIDWVSKGWKELDGDNQTLMELAVVIWEQGLYKSKLNQNLLNLNEDWQRYT